MRDKSYPILAVAWGRAIQLVVYSNFANSDALRKGKVTPELLFDGFYIVDGENCTIDYCAFLSESVLFVIVNKTEVRILYT